MLERLRIVLSAKDRPHRSLGERLRANWTLKLLSVGLAVALWFLVVGQEKAEISLKVPIEISSPPEGQVIVGEAPDEVDVRVYGPRSLVRQLADRRMSKTIPLTGLKSGEHIYQVVPSDLNLPASVKVVRISPASFKITLAPQVSRMVSVRPVVQGTPATGFELGEISIKPEKIKVSGLAEQLEDLDWIWTVPLNVQDLSRDSSMQANLRMPQGRSLRLDPPVVDVRVRVIPTRQSPAPSPGQAPAADQKTSPTKE